MSESYVEVTRLLVYRGKRTFVERSLLHRYVIGVQQHPAGSITEILLSSDAGVLADVAAAIQAKSGDTDESNLP